MTFENIYHLPDSYSCKKNLDLENAKLTIGNTDKAAQIVKDGSSASDINYLYHSLCYCLSL